MAFRINICRIWLAQLVAPLAATAFFLSTAGALAQTVEPDEAVSAAGAVTQSLALTAAQKSAIYNAVSQQKVRTNTTAISATVGAPVPPSTALTELPDQIAIDQPWAEFLKYAMVEDDVVVVDPISMRVVDVIHGSARP
jgi:hypothetical protein